VAFPHARSQPRARPATRVSRPSPARRAATAAGTETGFPAARDPGGRRSRTLEFRLQTLLHFADSLFSYRTTITAAFQPASVLAWLFPPGESARPALDRRSPQRPPQRTARGPRPASGGGVARDRLPARERVRLLDATALAAAPGQTTAFLHEPSATLAEISDRSPSVLHPHRTAEVGPNPCRLPRHAPHALPPQRLGHRGVAVAASPAAARGRAALRLLRARNPTAPRRPDDAPDVFGNNTTSSRSANHTPNSPSPSRSLGAARGSRPPMPGLTPPLSAARPRSQPPSPMVRIRPRTISARLAQRPLLPAAHVLAQDLDADILPRWRGSAPSVPALAAFTFDPKAPRSPPRSPKCCSTGAASARIRASLHQLRAPAWSPRRVRERLICSPRRRPANRACAAPMPRTRGFRSSSREPGGSTTTRPTPASSPPVTSSSPGAAIFPTSAR